MASADDSVLSYPFVVDTCAWRFVSILFLLLRLAAAQTAVRPPSGPQPQSTLYIDCKDKQSEQTFSPVSISEDHKWQAQVEVGVQGDFGCVYTTRLWVAGAKQSHRLVYLIAPKREAQGNGMEILGWAPKSRYLLVRTDEWQVGSDALNREGVLAIDAENGMVYEPGLEHMLEGRKNKGQCMFRVTEAGFRTGDNVDILVRAKFSTYYDPAEVEEDVPPAKRCDNSAETWSFNFATGAIKRVSNSEPLRLFKKFTSGWNRR